MEANEAAELIRENIDSDANIIFGVGSDESLGDDIKITVIATGFDNGQRPSRREEISPQRSQRRDFEAPSRNRVAEEKKAKKNPFDDIDLPDFLK